MVDLGKHDAAFTKQRFVPGAMSEIRIDRLTHLIHARAQTLSEPAQVRATLLHGRAGFEPGAPQPVEAGAEIRRDIDCGCHRLSVERAKNHCAA